MSTPRVDRLTRLPACAPATRQTGVAAIEFALISMVLITVLAGIVGFGALFWMQQRLSQFAGDTVRTALYAYQINHTPTAGLQSVACREALRATDNRISCVLAVVPCETVPGRTNQCVRADLTFAVADWPVAAALTAILNAIPTGRAERLVPQTLAASAAVQIR